MPAKSKKQATFMRACAHDWKPKGNKVKCPSKKVARKFMKTESKVSTFKQFYESKLSQNEKRSKEVAQRATEKDEKRRAGNKDLQSTKKSKNAAEGSVKRVEKRGYDYTDRDI